MNIPSTFSFRQLAEARLLAAIDSITREVNGYDKTNIHIAGATDSLDKAKALSRKDASNAWNYIQEAELLLLHAMEDAAWRAKARQICIEAAEKIPSWRQKQIGALLGTADAIRADIVREDVVAAAKIRNEHYQTQFYRISLRRVNFNILAFLLVLFIATVVGTVLAIDISQPTAMWQKVLVSLEFGALGACLSMAYTLTATPVNSKIPDHMVGFYITVIRLAIGATAALVALMLLNSTLLTNVFSEEFLTSPYSYIIIAFIAGFSERWVVSVIDLVANDKSK